MMPRSHHCDGSSCLHPSHFDWSQISAPPPPAQSPSWDPINGYPTNPLVSQFGPHTAVARAATARVVVTAPAQANLFLPSTQAQGPPSYGYPSPYEHSAHPTVTEPSVIEHQPQAKPPVKESAGRIQRRLLQQQLEEEKEAKDKKEKKEKKEKQGRQERQGRRERKKPDSLSLKEQLKKASEPCVGDLKKSEGSGTIRWV